MFSTPRTDEKIQRTHSHISWKCILAHFAALLAVRPHIWSVGVVVAVARSCPRRTAVIGVFAYFFGTCWSSVALCADACVGCPTAATCRPILTGIRCTRIFYYSRSTFTTWFSAVFRHPNRITCAFTVLVLPCWTSVVLVNTAGGWTSFAAFTATFQHVSRVFLAFTVFCPIFAVLICIGAFPSRRRCSRCRGFSSCSNSSFTALAAVFQHIIRVFLAFSPWSPTSTFGPWITATSACSGSFVRAWIEFVHFFQIDSRESVSLSRNRSSRSISDGWLSVGWECITAVMHHRLCIIICVEIA